MNETIRLQGRNLGPVELGQVREIIAGHAQWTRFRISRELALRWNWRSASGQLKDMAARTLLLKLEERGFIQLPARRWTPPNRMRDKRVPALDPNVSQEPIRTALANLLPLEVREVSAGFTADRRLFDALLHRFHYLSYRSPVGENLQYLARERTGRPVACLLFGSAAWQCADRDRYLGWAATTRAERLHLLTNNHRFLLLPWVNSMGLASHVLGLVQRRIGADWQRKYGHPIYLLETFVERERFAGTCYQAANWIRVGQTKGRTRQDTIDGRHQQAALKDIYLFPLDRRLIQRLQEPSTPIPHESGNPHSTPAPSNQAGPQDPTP